ncbi:MAG: aminotransferase class V-fold PLP-dependent enzyme [Acidobacteria bacterium]|nr:MAG: aminotransferase class V-fold PLP-dependent enzyme [Acidobacteriota bacterium]
MLLNRKDFFRVSAVGVSLLSACRLQRGFKALSDEWTRLHDDFELSRDYVHMACLLMASHPRPVREAIERYRSELDKNPALYLEDNNQNLLMEVRRAAADYLGAQAEEIALTDSTTMGLGMVYNGVKISPEDEILTSNHDYYATLEAVRYKSIRTGATVKKISLYEKIESVSEAEILSNLRKAIRPETRLLAVTWVHSSTGLKIPVASIGAMVSEINARRPEKRRLMLAVDGVHALGMEDFKVTDLDCDFLMAGTHKWLFGPRGTGIIWGHPRSHSRIIATIPSFTGKSGWGGWMTPGGFHSFEHRWAAADAFRYHQKIGKTKIRDRIRALNTQLKEGLASMSHVKLYTPMDPNLSAGIVCFDLEGLTPAEVVSRLREKHIVASETPYEPSHARMTPGIINNPEDVDKALAAVWELRS